MEEIEYEVIKKAFLDSYKAFVDCATLTHNGYSMYSILVMRTAINSNLEKVNIIIRNSHNGDNMLNEYSNNAILTKRVAMDLLEDIRQDFKDKHVILYASVNPKTFIQTLQNNMFSLNIKLNNEQELNKAVEFNDKINRNAKTKVLTQN